MKMMVKVKVKEKRNNIRLNNSYHKYPLGFLFLLFFAKLGKSAVRIRHEFLGGLVLEDFTTTEKKNSIRVDDRVKTMGDRENCRFSEFFADKLLDCLLSHYIDVGSGFI